MTDYSNITDQQIYDAIRKVATEAPETIYRDTVPDHMRGYTPSGCYYVHSDATDVTKLAAGCLIGKALHSLGVSLSDMADTNMASAPVMMDRLGIGSGKARFVALDIQERQDSGIPWGNAIQGVRELAVSE